MPLLFRSRLFFFLLLVVFPIKGWSRSFTVKEALQIALEKSPELISARNQLEGAELENKNAFASFLPSLDLSASHGVRGLSPDPLGLTAQTPWVSGATLSLTENFYDNGESFKKYRLSGLRLEQARLHFQKRKAEIVQAVILAYHRYNIATLYLKFSEKNHQELERLAKLVTNQFQQGLKTRKDFLNFKSRAQRGQLNVYEAESAVKEARGNLLSAMGLATTEDLQVDAQERPVLPKTNFKMDLVPEDLYEQRTLNLQKEIADLEVELSRRRFWPELNLVGAVSYGSSEYLGTGRSWSDNDSTQWSVLLNLKFNIIDWGVRNRNIQTTRLAQDTAQQSLRAALYRAEKDLERFKVEAQRSSEGYRLAKELLKMEEDTFRLLESDYRSGRASYLELTTGLSNLLDAQSRGQEADYNQASLYLRWKYYKGILNETTAFE